MRQEIALEADGAPMVRAFRSDEGHLVFRYLVVRPGGMGVWLQVDEKALAARATGGEARLDRQLRAAVAVLVEGIAAGDAAAREEREALEAQVESLGSELEAARAEIASLKAGQATVATGGGGQPKTKSQPRRAAA